MPELTGPQVVTLRTHPHRVKSFLAVLKPTTIYSRRVDDATIAKGERDIHFDGGAIVVANIVPGMSLLVSDGTDGAAGQQDKGRVRIKSAVDDGDGTGTITVAENEHIDWEDNDFLTVKDIHEYWVVYPRITDTGGLDFFKDYDVDYDPVTAKQNENLYPVPIMGPPACAFIDPDTLVATVYFDGVKSYCPGSSVQWGAGNSEWTFPGGTPASSTAATPGNVTFDTPGAHTVRLKAKAANDQVTYGYRYVFIFERTGVNAPYTEFEVQRSGGSVSEGGWAQSYAVHGDADEGEFPDGTMVVHFAEAYYGDEAKDFGMNHAGRHNIRAVGWLVKDTVRKDPVSGDVTFEVQGVVGLMKTRENFMCALDWVDVPPEEWHQLINMDTDRALHHYLYWYTTVFTMTDVFVSGEIHPSCPGPFKIASQDFARGSIWTGLSKLCEEAFLVPVADRASCLYLDYNPQMLPEADRAVIPIVMLLEHQDWQEALELERVEEKVTNFVDFDGIAFDGTTAEPVISYAPGRAPEYTGSPKPSQKHVLDPDGDWQGKSNVLAGLKLAWDNNEFPSIRFPCVGDYSVADIAPREFFKLTLVAGDTKRGIVWDEQKLLVSSIEERYDHQMGTCQVVFDFEKEAIGPAGVDGDYPPDEPPEPPGPPGPPEPPAPGGWRKKVYAATKDKGIYYTETFSGPGEDMPTWETVNEGLSSLHTYDIKPDPFNPGYRQYCRTGDPIISEVSKIYRRVGGGSWEVILDSTIINTLLPAGWVHSELVMVGPDANINAQGHVYVVASFYDGGAWGRVLYFFKSTDYGDTWSAVRVYDNWFYYVTVVDFEVGALKGTSPYGAGQVIYVAFRAGITQDAYMKVSVTQGASWGGVIGLYNCRSSGVEAFLHRSSANQDVLYQVGWGSAVAGEFNTLMKTVNRGGAWTTLWACHLAPPKMTQQPNMYVWNPFSSFMAGGQYGLYWTEDDWATYETHTNSDGLDVDGCSRIMDAPELLYGWKSANPSGSDMKHVIAVSINRGDNWQGRAGPNPDTPPYTDSIPSNCGGVACILEIWTE